MIERPDIVQSAASDPVLSVVVPHYNDLENLSVCLANLRAQSLSAGQYEIIVVDNNSACDRSQLEALCGREARLVDAPLQGAAEARNAGVHAARGNVFAFIDSDCRPCSTWLEAGCNALQIAPLVGGRIEVSVGDATALTPTEAFERIFAFNNERYIREERFSVTANMFTTRAVFDRVGGFRTGVSEDVDWGRRAVAAGYRWHYAPDALVEHPARRDWPDLARKWKRLTSESYRLASEGRRGQARWLIRNWLMFFSLPLAMVQVLRSDRVAGVGDRLKALATLVRLRFWRLREAHRVLSAREP